MRAVVPTHVDQFGRALHAAKCRFGHSLGFTHESHHSAVGSLAGVHVEQTNTLHALYSVGD